MRAPARTIWIAAAVWAAIFAFLNWWKWISYHANGDFGIFVQTIASGFPAYHNMEEGGNHFGVHFSPVYALFQPLMDPAQTVLPLLVAPAIAGALVGPGMFYLARRLMSPGLALGVAFVALLYPALAGLIFGDPFENVFAPAATVWLLYGFEARKPAVIALAAIAALAVKEDQALFVAATGLFMAWRYRSEPGNRRNGLIVAAASVATFALYFGVLRPAAGGHWTGSYFYDWKHATLDVAPITSPIRLTYVIEVLLPLLFLPLRTPLALLALPPFAELLASPYTILVTNGTHYAGVWIGYVLVAYAYGVATIAPERRARWAVTASLVLCLLQLTLASPTHWRVRLSIPNAHDATLTRVLASLPRDATIGAYEEAYSHLGFYPGAVEGLRGTPAFVVIDTTRPTSYFVPILTQYVHAHPAYALRSDDDGIEVWALHGAPGAGAGAKPRV
jgi:uncharacterized membrane protein